MDGNPAHNKSRFETVSFILENYAEPRLTI